jgi:hypothetical protein
MAARMNVRLEHESTGGTARAASRRRGAPRTPVAPASPAAQRGSARHKGAKALADRAAAARPAPARSSRPQRTPPPLYEAPVARCDDLAVLRALSPAAARDHVDAALHAAMPPAQADAFEARSYRWELHLVALDQLCLLRGVDLVPSRLRRYRAAIRRGESCAPLIGLGGDGNSPTEAILLCDGYHRAVALRDAGLHFAWVWLAIDLWRDPATQEQPVA